MGRVFLSGSNEGITFFPRRDTMGSYAHITTKTSTSEGLDAPGYHLIATVKSSSTERKYTTPFVFKIATKYSISNITVIFGILTDSPPALFYTDGIINGTFHRTEANTWDFYIERQDSVTPIQILSVSGGYSADRLNEFITWRDEVVAELPTDGWNKSTSFMIGNLRSNEFSTTDVTFQDLTVRKIQVTSEADAAADADNVPGLIIGPRTGNHLEIDQNELVVKATDTTAGTLYINAEGGDVRIGSGKLYLNGVEAATVNYVTSQITASSWIDTAYLKDASVTYAKLADDVLTNLRSKIILYGDTVPSSLADHQLFGKY